MNNSRVLIWLVLMIAVASSLQWLGPVSSPERDDGPASSRDMVQEAFARRLQGQWLESSGKVIKLLRDDLQGSRHQRFIVRTPSGVTVLVSHNIDLAPRVRLQPGYKLSFRGRYEWNDRGGVVHWTHHDPAGRIKGGWIECLGTCRP